MQIHSFDISNLFCNFPDVLKKSLIDSYNEILKNYRERRWEPSELNGGKFCEVVYTILKGYVDGIFPSKPSKPQNMVDACRSFERLSPNNFPRSIRIQIPRMLIALYEIRNNRGVGHTGGDVDPNHMDANAVIYMSKWILAELIRVFHNVDIKTASSTVDIIVERLLPVIWEVNGKIRVLNTKLTMKEKSMVILYYSVKSINESSLVEWVEHSNTSAFRRDVLRKLHKDKLIEYDDKRRTITISPKGINFVEESINLDI